MPFLTRLPEREAPKTQPKRHQSGSGKVFFAKQAAATFAQDFP